MLYRFIVAIIKPFFYFLYRMSIVGKANIVPDAAVVCCNHSSNLDPIILAAAFGTSYQLCFMAKKELFDIPILSSILRTVGTFPVNRGAADINAIKDSIALLKSGKKVMLFPQGTRAKGDETQGESVKTGIALLAVRANVPIIPVYVSENKKLFKRTKVIIGKPISPEKQQGTASENYRRIADSVFSELMSLKSDERL